MEKDRDMAEAQEEEKETISEDLQAGDKNPAEDSAETKISWLEQKPQGSMDGWMHRRK